MAIIATFDLGTTALKAVVMNEKQEIIFLGKEDIKTYYSEHFQEQNPEEWWEAFCKLSNRFNAKEVTDIILSGQMQDLYFMDGNDTAIGNAVLYNDQRGSNYVESLPSYISEETSINMDGSIPIAKYLWFKEHKPETLIKAKHLLISAKDYIILKLTGRYVSDTTTMSTSGMMNIKTKGYVELSSILDTSLLPDILYSDEIVGNVNEKASLKTGYSIDAKVFAGTGDAGATTLASGVIHPREFSVNLGTSGWVAAISEAPMNGVFNLAAINRGYYINVIPVLNAASVHNWITRLLFDNDKDRYDKAHELLTYDANTNPNLLCLPYLVGERFPVADDSIRGSFIGLDNNTSKTDLIRSALEGVAFSLRMGLEKQGGNAINVTLVGGGSNEDIWCQIFSDIFNAPVTVFENSEILPSMALSAVVLYGNHQIDSYEEFINNFLRKQQSKVYLPNQDKLPHYSKLYERFKKIYPAIKAI